MPDIRCEKLQNGYIRAYSYASGLSSVWNTDGTYRSGDLDGVGAVVRAWINGRRK